MKKKKTKYSDQEIDAIVVREAVDESAWGKPIHVKAMSIVPIALSPKLIEKAKNIARRRGAKGHQAWMKSVIRERIKQEESASPAVQR